MTRENYGGFRFIHAFGHVGIKKKTWVILNRIKPIKPETIKGYLKPVCSYPKVTIFKSVFPFLT